MTTEQSDRYLDVASLSAFQYCPYRFEQEQTYRNREMTDEQLLRLMGKEQDQQRKLLWQKEWKRRHNERMPAAEKSVSPDTAARRVSRALLIGTLLIAGIPLLLAACYHIFASGPTWLEIITTFILVFAIVFGLSYYWWQRRQRTVVIYRKSAKAKPLVNEEWLCQGVPDLIEQIPGGELIVTLQLTTNIEHNRKRPYEGDILQLGAYFLLAKNHYRTRIRIGRIEYRNRTFEIQDTESLHKHVTRTLHRLRLFQKSGKLPTIPIVKEKCKVCVFYQTVCEKNVSM